MLSTKVRDDARLLLEAVKAAGPLLEILETFAKAQHEADDQQFVFAEGKPERRAEASSNIHRMYAISTKHLGGRSLRTIFRASERLMGALEAFGGSVAAQEISEQVLRFDELLDQFSSSHSIGDGARLMRMAERLLTRLKAMQQDLAQFADQLDPEVIAPGEDIAVFGLFDEYTLREVAEKLIAMDDICKTVSEVLEQYDIPTDFRVRKIETGSLSIEIIAQRLGIIALKRVLKGGVDYWYRNHTREGQLRFGVRDTNAALKDAVKLRNALAKEGVKVDGIDEALARQTARLVNRIGELAGFADEVRLDDHIHVRVETPRTLKLPQSTPEPRRLGHDPAKDSGSNPHGGQTGGDA